MLIYFILIDFNDFAGGAAAEGLPLRPAGTHAHTEVGPAARQDEQGEFSSTSLARLPRMQKLATVG